MPWPRSGHDIGCSLTEIEDRHVTDEIEPDYHRISVPTLIIWGADDSWIPVDRAQRLHALIPGSELRIIEDCGHLVQEDQPAHLNRLLRDWVERTSGLKESA